MDHVFCFLLFFAVILFVMPITCSQCASGLCERKTLSLKANTKHNYSLHYFVFKAFNFSIWEECYNMCVRNCQCLSFNFNKVNKTENCELNDATAKLTPKALKKKEGVVYYEIARAFYDKNVSTSLQNSI